MKKIIFIVTLTLVMTWGVTPYADIYKYVDENGVAHFTNIPAGKEYKKIVSVKPRHRGKKSDITSSANYRQIIYTKSREYNIDPSLVNAIIKVESNWNSNAVSKRGAQGLMQLMPFTAKKMDVKNPFKPEENIEGGIKYLRYLLDKFNGDLSLALAAYNAGPKKIEKFGGIPPIPETRKYVKKILSIYYGGNSSNKKPTPIYKVIYNDGTVLYTNTPISYGKHNLSRL